MTQLIENLSNDDYHARSEFSSSQLKDMIRSPAHFWANNIDPNRKVKEATKDMNLGTAVHALFLEPENFANEVAVKEKVNSRTKAGKEYNAKFDEESQGKAVIDTEQYETAKLMTEQLQAHPFLAELMVNNHCKAEDSIIFTTINGLQLRVRPDLHIPPCERFPNGLIIDVKTTDDARPTEFARTCGKFRYDLSAVMYQEGFQQYYQTDELPPFYFAVVERKSPYGCAVYQASEDMLANGKALYDKAQMDLLQCLLTQEWDGYSPELTSIDLPKYMKVA